MKYNFIPQSLSFLHFLSNALSKHVHVYVTILCISSSFSFQLVSIVLKVTQIPKVEPSSPNLPCFVLMPDIYS